MKEIEATAALVKREDGWRIELTFDDGTVVEQQEPPFATREEAERAFRQFTASDDVRVSATAQ